MYDSYIKLAQIGIASTPFDYRPGNIRFRKQSVSWCFKERIPVFCLFLLVLKTKTNTKTRTKTKTNAIMKNCVQKVDITIRKVNITI